MLKRLLKSDAGVRAAGTLAGAIVRMINATTRWEHVADPAAAALLAGDQPVIGAFWHNRLMLISAVWPKGKPIAMVQSEHGDSRILGIAVSEYITRPIWGSSRRNPMAALKGMLRALQEGLSVGITPDGPRGPRMRCRPGLIHAAKRSGVPIVPGAWSVSRRSVARSWDRFIIAWPFGRGVIVLGAPIRVPADADETGLEACRRQVEDALNAVAAEADRRMGHAPIEPAPERKAGR
ncbi:hypothetical protein BAL199_06826 [alpha proteobacterium BAL199]|jgi:lysophospholipid acyltransferase (LPLAT)-like uncharacterized protein|nr:hypothetical protein BAL199_06826 [alpha proteobacterium BAL199]